MKHLKEFIYEQVSSKKENEEPEKLTPEAVAELTGTDIKDINKCIDYINHNEPSLSHYGSDQVENSGVKEPEVENPDEQEKSDPYIPKVVSAIKMLRDDGYFKSSNENEPSEKKTEETKEEE